MDRAGVSSQNADGTAHRERLGLKEVVLGLGRRSSPEKGSDEEAWQQRAQGHLRILALHRGSVEALVKRDSFPPIAVPGKKRQMVALNEATTSSGPGKVEQVWIPFVCGNT